MFSNFKDTFVRKPQFNGEVPQCLMDMLNSELPDNLKYTSVENGVYALDFTNGVKISSNKIKLEREENENLPENPTVDDIIRYSYNAQIPIIIEPNDNGCFTINGKEIPASKCVIAPLKNIVLNNGHFVLFPYSFPKPISIQISGYEHKYDLQFQRVPNNHISIIKFANTNDNSIFNINLFINPQKDEKVRLTISIQNKNLKTAHDHIIAYSIMNAFIDGTGMICNQKINVDSITQTEKYPPEAFEFWQEVETIQEICHLSFDTSKGIENSDYMNVKRLYRSLMNKKPFKSNNSYNSITGTGKIDDYILESKGKECCFQFTRTTERKVFNKTIKCFELVCIFGAVIKDFISNDKGYEALLESSKRISMYDSTMIFLSEKELVEYCNVEHDLNKYAEAEEIE